MAAPRTGDGAAQGQKRSQFSRRSPSSSPARFSAVRAPSRSPSPRTKRLRRAQEERDLERSRDRDRGRSHDRDKGRDRGRVKTRDREDDDRTVTREKDRGRDRIRGNSWEQERPRDRRGRDRQRDSSPVRSPLRSRHERSLSPKDSRQRRPPSPRRSPHHQRNSKQEQHLNTGTTTAARDEGDGDAGKDRDRDNETTPKQDDALLKMKEIEAALEKEAKEKEKPSFEYSGKLAAETNKVKGVTLQFTEPPEARKPSTRWRLYVFKDGEPLNDPLYIHRQTCYLFGRERRVADIPTDHPSCSKQHAVIQYRLTEKEEASGATSNKVRPYLMDLGSTNGTFLNAERLESQRYYEMFEKDTIKFGNSSREYVLLHEHSAG
ncbi:smad nuclear-interacting protein 1 [Marchantia polymorpha subsp. ruderalis]